MTVTSNTYFSSGESGFVYHCSFGYHLNLVLSRCFALI